MGGRRRSARFSQLKITKPYQSDSIGKKRLEDIERERAWPARSAKVVLQLALDRLARHYGYAAQTKGRTQAPICTWLADGATFSVDGG